MSRLRAVLAGPLALLAAVTLAGPATAVPVPAHPAAVPPLAGALVASAAPGQPAQPTRPAQPARRTLAGMGLRQQVGQLFMVGTPASRADPRTLRQLRSRAVGSVILTGRSRAGVAETARVVRTLRAAGRAAAQPAGLLVAVDQEGGLVQVLRGPGFSTMPTALEQGGWTPQRLRTAAARWGAQLRRAGVDLDLAPVLDTVPSARFAPRNRPIGYFHRQFGYTPRTVTSHGLAVAAGLRGAGVAATAKHFPGLGRVRGNTDDTAGVTDRVTRRDDPYLRPFRAAVSGGVGFVMMSTARYQRLDPRRPAAFSRFVVTRMLRGDLGFRGVVVSDDLAHARQVAGVAPGRRATRFVAAGGDLVLSVDPAVVPAMYDAVLARAQADPAFRAQVRAAALRVLTAKQRRGLLS